MAVLADDCLRLTFCLLVAQLYHVYRGSQLAAVVKKSLFTFFHCKFTVDVPGPDDLEAKGDFLDHEYSFSRGGRTVASVSKKWFSLDGHLWR